MSINLQGYWDNINAPWGQLFYKLIWHHLPYKEMNILDYGSGFGITANYLAIRNTVTAVEPNKEMVAARVCKHLYKQIVGGRNQLEKLPARSYDVILCHNVLEYVNERETVFRAFHRLLKDGGTISLVKHNKAGKIMQKAVFENNIDETINLIKGENAVSVNFGAIKEYSTDELEEYIANLYKIQKLYGVRTFFGLQKNEFKSEPDWLSNIFRLECAVEEIPVFRDIAFYHHFILKKQ